MKYDALIVGGGAAGFYAAIHLAEKRPDWSVGILEKGVKVLQKVRISGGGRCNVTHAVWEPAELAAHYPRGMRELLGPFHRYAPSDTMAFFQDRNVPLKIEEDGRIFPVSDDSQSIIDCLLGEARRFRVEVRTQTSLRALASEGGNWRLETSKGEFTARLVLIATGSSPQAWSLLDRLGHRIVEPVPSLFTFKSSDPLLDGLQGLSVDEISLAVAGHRDLNSTGPLLITHWGLSGPATLKLSAWGARGLNTLDYRFDLRVNWLPGIDRDRLRSRLETLKSVESRKKPARNPLYGIPRRLWERLVNRAGISKDSSWAVCSQDQIARLCEVLQHTPLRVEGKSTFKEEFVTAGGIDLKEVDFRTFQSRLHPGLFFAGEVLDIDAITGGFNFQNAWTGAYHAAMAMAAVD